MKRKQTVLNNNRLLLPIFIGTFIICIIPIVFQKEFLSIYNKFEVFFINFENLDNYIQIASLNNNENFAKLAFMGSIFSFIIAFFIALYIFGKTYLCSLGVYSCSNKLYIDNLIKRNRVTYQSYKGVCLFILIVILLFDIYFFGYLIDFSPENSNPLLEKILHTKLGIFLLSYGFSFTLGILSSFLIIESIAHYLKFRKNLQPQLPR